MRESGGTYLVEHYLPGATPESFRAAAGRLRSVAATMTSGGTPVRYRQAILVPTDEAAFCVFDAPRCSSSSSSIPAPASCSIASSTRWRSSDGEA